MNLKYGFLEQAITSGKVSSYRAFHRFGQAKFADGGLILGSNQLKPLPQLPLK